jgi:hypothetical protein
MACNLKTGPVLTFWFGSVGPELHLPFDTSSLVGCCLQSHEILLNKGMKYWDSEFFLNKGMKYWDSAVIGAPSLQAFLMDIHHYTSLKSILEVDSVSSTSRVCIIFVRARGQGYGWLLGHLSVHFTSHILLSPQYCVFASVWFNFQHLVFSHVNMDTNWMHLACI